MFSGALSHPERLDGATAFGGPTCPQADPQSRARHLQRIDGHLKPVSDLLPADTLCHPVFNSCDIFGREFSWLSTLNQWGVILPNSCTSYRRHNLTSRMDYARSSDTASDATLPRCL